MARGLEAASGVREAWAQFICSGTAGPHGSGWSMFGKFVDKHVFQWTLRTEVTRCSFCLPRPPDTEMRRACSLRLIKRLDDASQNLSSWMGCGGVLSGPARAR